MRKGSKKRKEAAEKRGGAKEIRPVEKVGSSDKSDWLENLKNDIDGDVVNGHKKRKSDK